MAYIFMIGRTEARKIVNKYTHYLTGECLDVGSQSRRGRYAELLKDIDDYTSLDINSDCQPDIVSDAEDMKMVESESFNSILCAQVLPLVKHPEKAIKEFNRVLKQKGHVLITVPFLNLCIGDYDYWRFTPAGISLLLEENGFKVIALETSGIGVFSVRHQLLTKFIKIKLNLGKRHRVVWGAFNKIFILTAKIAFVLDRMLGSVSNGQFFLDVIVLARKD